jgi:hypothetical protein
MNFAKLFKKIETSHIVVGIAALALLFAVYNYSTQKSVSQDGMKNDEALMSQVSQSQVVPSDGKASQPAELSGVQTSTHGLPPSCARQQVVDPRELLPRDENSEWAKLNPMGAGDLQQVNLLESGYHIGVNTVSSTLRNPNLQLRSEIPNPQMQVSPWNITTIEPDTNRRPLEIGGSM